MAEPSRKSDTASKQPKIAIPPKPKDRGGVPKTVILKTPPPDDDGPVVGEDTVVTRDACAPFRKDELTFLKDVAKKPERPEGVAKTEILAGYVPGEDTRKAMAVLTGTPEAGFIQGPKPAQGIEAPREFEAYKKTGETPAAKPADA